MLESNTIIESNRMEVLSLVDSISREGANKDKLKDYLEHSDYFIAPASTKYYNSYEGGLVMHSLNVYHNLKTLVSMKGLQNEISEESIIICALFHDISKVNFYEKYVRNEKQYCQEGYHHDSIGNFEWVSKQEYKVKSSNDRFIYGNHEETSEYMIRTFIPLTLDESIAILNHHGGMGFDSVPSTQIHDKYNKSKLTCLLHIADLMSVYIDE